MNIILIAAMGQKRELGYQGDLLWHLPGDLPRFKQLTMGCPIIMGRKTFDSIGKPLPGRTNIVLTQNQQFNVEGITTANTEQQALEQAKATQSDDIFVIGGGEIYTVFLPYANRLELTLVEDSPAQADAFFPDYSDFGFTEISRQHNEADSLKFDYVSLERTP